MTRRGGRPNDKLGTFSAHRLHITGFGASHPGIKVNCCCPGYCDTDMTSHRGPRSAHDGAQNAVTLATLPPGKLPSGAFFQNGKVSAW